MHYPLQFPIGQGYLSAHLLFEMLAYILGYRLYVWQRAHTHDLISDENRAWIFIGAAAGAFLGSHGLGMLEHPDYLASRNWYLWLGNKTILGGLLGGLIGVEGTKKMIGVHTSSGDLLTYPLLLGLAVGRIGCHFAGLTDGTHGLPTDLPWGMDFGDGTARHPVNLYEVALLATCTLALFLREKKGPLPNGRRFQYFMVTYLCWRFAADFLKPVWIWPRPGLSTLQVAALAGLAYYGWLLSRAKPQAPPCPLLKGV